MCVTNENEMKMSITAASNLPSDHFRYRLRPFLIHLSFIIVKISFLLVFVCIVGFNLLSEHIFALSVNANEDSRSASEVPVPCQWDQNLKGSPAALSA